MDDIFPKIDMDEVNEKINRDLEELWDNQKVGKTKMEDAAENMGKTGIINRGQTRGTRERAPVSDPRGG